MNKMEWERRLPFDRKGVTLLGAALFFRTERLSERADRMCQRVLQMDDDRKKDYQSPEFYSNGASYWRSRGDDVLLKLNSIGAKLPAQAVVSSLRAKDFRYRWDILQANMSLLAYISDEQPELTRDFDRETPICRRDNGDLVKAMNRVFFSEVERIRKYGPDGVPRFSGEEDYWFYLSVWKHCEPELGPGQPRGRRWNDGLVNAAAYATSLEHKAKIQGSPISREETIRRAVEQFEIIGSDEYEDHPDKEAVIVTNAGAKNDPEARRAGAMRAIRAQLAKMPNAEKK